MSNPDGGAREFVPSGATSIDALREAAKGCRGCHLHENATQTVFGDGAADARVLMIGEQPGDVEDRRGEPFVGPAGKLLDTAMGEAGLDRDDAYVTNAVKHFKYTPGARGKRRVHRTPDRVEITACRPWLTAELSLLRPRVIVTLGATASQALLGPSFRVTASRGVLMPWPSASAYAAQFPTAPAQILATIHPSAVLRSDDRESALADLVADLRVAAAALGAGPPPD